MGAFFEISEVKESRAVSLWRGPELWLPRNFVVGQPKFFTSPTPVTCLTYDCSMRTFKDHSHESGHIFRPERTDFGVSSEQALPALRQ